MSFAGRTIAFDEKCTVKSVREENWKMLLKLFYFCMLSLLLAMSQRFK